MEGLQIRQGTVYRKKEDGSEFVLINHNPMQLQSLLLRRNGAAWDCSAPELIAVDTLIEIRKSSDYEELGDMASGDFKKLVETLLKADSLPEDHRELVEKL